MITDNTSSLKGKNLVTFSSYGTIFEPFGVKLIYDDNVANYEDVRKWLNNPSIDGITE